MTLAFSSAAFSPSRRAATLLLAVFLAVFMHPAAARASRVLAIVNDFPVTDFDVSQRLKLNSIIGGARSRKAALRSVINAAVMRTEAKKRGLAISDQQVEKALQNMARNMGGMAKLKATLRKRGVRMRTLRDYIRSSMLFRVLARRMGKKIAPRVNPGEVDRRYKKIINDPRLRPITIYNLRQVTLPVENVAPAMRQQLQYARMVEAQQIMKKYRGCASLRKATSGIFNVRISKPLKADPRRLPGPLKKAIRLAGTKRMIGPIRARAGIQLIAYCGTTKIVPPRPKKAQIEAMVKAEAFSREVERVMKQLRKKAFIDYKDKSAKLD